ncbi:MAG: hypothetical protein ACI9A7_001685 [Cyclobacteriaceae bacterium]|jgi:hypothetical protein
MKLTEEQEEKVLNCVEAQELKLKTLCDDIMDHLCCVIESGLGKRKSFDQLLHDAMSELAPNGLIDLERKTIFLLNSKRIIIMKKLTYFIGFIGSITFAAGFYTKILHLPGAFEIGMMGTILLLVFVPLLAFDKYKVAIARTMSEQLLVISGIAAVLFLGLAGLFKMLHLPGSPVILGLAMIVFTVGFLPFLFFTMYKKSVS